VIVRRIRPETGLIGLTILVSGSERAAGETSGQALRIGGSVMRTGGWVTRIGGSVMRTGGWVKG
jgi:hypothetical protein